MRIEKSQVTSMRIFEAEKLDPLTVIFEDFGGSGKVFIECYGQAWSAYWGAIGNENIAAFFLNCHNEYIAGKLTTKGNNTREFKYVCRIVCAVQQALKQEELQEASA